MVLKIKRALMSVSDKTGLVDLAQFLIEQKVEIISTGGSAKVLRESNIDVIEVSNFTQFPEIMEGRVKTLHPRIHGGILAKRGNKVHETEMTVNKIATIDLVVVNLYPFEKIVSAEKNYEECIENIDIGGPALIRAAAKNHSNVTVIVDPNDYSKLQAEMLVESGCTSGTFRKKNAGKAFTLTAAYDVFISSWFQQETKDVIPERMIISAELRQILRYGENPHQQGFFYQSNENTPGISSATQLQGKELSYNNLNDTDAAFELVGEFKEVAGCVIVKHANPCGVGLGDNLVVAYKKALRCDQESAFGGIIAFNKRVDREVALEVIKLFSEVIIAPEFDADALDIFKEKKNLRILVTKTLPNEANRRTSIKSVSGGFLVQSQDDKVFKELECVTNRAPSKTELVDLKFAFTVAKYVKSNAIVYAKDCATVGIGAGQMSRVNSCRIAAWKALDSAKSMGDGQSWAIGSVVASDAFFPFPDGLLAAAEAGVTAVIQPGGSAKDEEIIEVANDANLAMIFSGMRHFRH